MCDGLYGETGRSLDVRLRPAPADSGGFPLRGEHEPAAVLCRRLRDRRARFCVAVCAVAAVSSNGYSSHLERTSQARCANPTHSRRKAGSLRSLADDSNRQRAGDRLDRPFRHCCFVRASSGISVRGLMAIFRFNRGPTSCGTSASPITVRTILTRTACRLG